MAQKSQISYRGRMVDAPFQSGSMTADQNWASAFGKPPARTAAEAFASQGTPLGPPIPEMVSEPMTIGTDYGTPSLGFAPPPNFSTPPPATYAGADFSKATQIPIPQTVLPPAPNVESQSQATAAPTGFGGVEIPGVPTLSQNVEMNNNPMASMFPQGWQNLGDNYASLFGGQNYALGS